ncbi:MAG: hypothetical protein KDK36_00020, partial [Leptospiraceae bacterium]|nr:hypothetical protein [Leptospiraceae bacterium]
MKILLLILLLTYNCATLQEIVSNIDLEDLKEYGEIPDLNEQDKNPSDPNKEPVNNPTNQENNNPPENTPPPPKKDIPAPPAPENNPQPEEPSQPIEKIQVYRNGSPVIKKSYEGYKDNFEDPITKELTTFVSYSEEYRPLGFDLEELTLKFNNESYPAYKVKVYFANNAKDGIENYGANGSLKFFYKLNGNVDHNAYYYDKGSLNLIKTYKSNEIKNGRIDLHSFINLYKDGKKGIHVNKPIFAIIPSSKSSIIEALNEQNEKELEAQNKPDELKLKYISTNGIPYDATIEDQFGPSSHS